MKNTSKIIIALLLNFAFVRGEKGTIVLISPVLASAAHSSAKSGETAKDFPVLFVLAGDTNEIATGVTEVPRNEVKPQPIYVKKLEEQNHYHIRRRKAKAFKY